MLDLFNFFQTKQDISYYFLNDSRLGSNDVDVSIKIKELTYNEDSYSSKLMTSTEPPYMQNLVKRNDQLNT